MTKKPINASSHSVGVGISRATTRSDGSTTVTKTIGKGRSVGITMYEVDPRDIEDMLRGKRRAPRPPVSVTYYKPTRAQHYAALGKTYGVQRKPGQSLRAYASEVEKAIAAARARHTREGG